jgi:uncharacterized protein (DUF58 family)
MTISWLRTLSMTVSSPSMHPAENRIGRADGVTRVDLAELIALRARAGKPLMHAAHHRIPLAGGHVSALRGRGMDYAESRIYQAGDDVRNIDWRRTARSGKWHTKLFQAERERALLLLLDTHATMRFGTRVRYKSVAAARAAAWLAWGCVRGGDRVGAIAFGNVRAAVDPQGGTRGALGVLGAIARWDGQAQVAAADAAEPLSAALDRARRMAPPGSQVWLLSDGWCVDAAATHALARLARHAELRAVVLADPLEQALAPPGSYVFETPAGKQRVALLDATARTGLRDRLAHGWRGLTAACDAAAVPWVLQVTSAEPDACLTPLWRARSRRRRA